MTEKKMPPRYMRLKETHPTMVKLDKLYQLAEELGIHIEFLGQATIVRDEQVKGLPPCRMEDVDNREAISEWPPTFEYCLHYDNPAFIAAEKADYDAHMAQISALTRQHEEEQRARKAAEKKAREEAIERQERAEFIRLKAKYNE